MAPLQTALRILLNQVCKQGFAHRYHHCRVHAVESVSASCGAGISQAGLFHQTQVACCLSLWLHNKPRKASEEVKWCHIIAPGCGQGLLMGAGSWSSVHFLFLILPVQLQSAKSLLKERALLLAVSLQPN